MAPWERSHEAINKVKHTPADKNDVVNRNTESAQKHAEGKERYSLVDCAKYLREALSDDLPDCCLQHEQGHSEYRSRD